MHAFPPTAASLTSVITSLAAAVLLFAGGCYTGLGDNDGGAEGGAGEADGDAGDDDGPAPELLCEAVGNQPLRRISGAQYERILAELLPGQLGVAALEVSKFPRTSINAGFSTYASANTISTNESIAIEDNAEAIAAVFADNFDAYAPLLMPCLPEGFGDDDIEACVESFITDFGARVFRRPVTEAEATLVRELYAGVTATDGVRAGLTAVLQFFVQSPGLLYVTELGRTSEGEFAFLKPAELAVRLALLFTDASPDEELLAAVDQGRLLTREDVEVQARRLVESPLAVRAFATFHHEWMSGFALDDAQRDHELWDSNTRAALQQELRQFATWFYEDTDGSFETLMTSEAFAPDARLDPIYAAGDGPPRRGLLTTAAAMASRAHDDSTSLVERGAFLRAHVLCIPAPPFPGDVDIDGTLGDFTELPTARQRLEPLLLEPSCAGCHSGINPLGFPFEVYDWVGAYRTTENGTTIDATAEVQLGILDGTFDGPQALVGAIAATDDARNCYATHWFRYAMGRPDSPDDQCSLETVHATFADSGGDVRELLVAIATSDAFLFKRVGGTN